MQPISLTALAEKHLDAARQAASGRSAHTIRGGRRHSLHQTLLALVAGRGLDEHQSPGEATLLILRGRVRLATAGEVWEAAAGEYLEIPLQGHTLSAIEDSAVLLTVLTGVPGVATPDAPAPERGLPGEPDPDDDAPSTETLARPGL